MDTVKKCWVQKQNSVRGQGSGGSRPKVQPADGFPKKEKVSGLDQIYGTAAAAY